MKKILTLICLSVFMVIAMPKNTLAAEYGGIMGQGTSGDVEWVLYEASDTVPYRTLVVSGNGAMADYTSENSRPLIWINAKSLIVEDGVTHIGDGAFSSCTNLYIADVADSVTSIGEDAFYYCYQMKSVNLSNKLTTIGDGAFSYCSSVEQLNLAETVTSIGASAFLGCGKMNHVDLPENLESLGRYAFRGCKGLESITIPSKLTAINIYTFAWCENVKTITLNEGLISIEMEAFRGTNIESIHLPSTLKSTGARSFGDIPTLKSITIAEGNENLTKIDGVLYSADLKTLYLAENGITKCETPDTVRKITNGAFTNCSELKSVYIPAKVSFLSSDVFEGATKLEEFVVSEESNSFTAVDGILYNKSKTTLQMFPKGKQLTDFRVPDGVTTIADSAMKNCDNLVNVIIPESVTLVESYALKFCKNLERVVVLNPECEFKYPAITGGGHVEDKENTDIIIVGYLDSTAQTEANKVKLVFEELVVEDKLAVELTTNVSSALLVGDDIKLTANANGGYGTYQYSFIVYDVTKNYWYRFCDFSDAKSFVWTANSAGQKVLYAEAKDWLGNVARSNGVNVAVTSNELKVSIATKSLIVSNNASVSFTATATGGTGEYTYSFIMYNNDQGYWHRLNSFSMDEVYSWYASTSGNKTFYVEVKDSAGKVVRSEGVKVTVLEPLLISLNANAKSVVKGSNLALTATASGGAGGYTYSFIMYNEDKGYWYRFSDFKEVNKLSWIASTAEARKFYVEVKDAYGQVVRSEAISVEVLESYNLTASLNSDKSTVGAGTTVKFTANATGGSGNYSYSFLMYNPTSKGWHRFSDFASSNVMNWTALGSGEREFYVEIKDSAGIIVRSKAKVITIK